VSDTSPGFLIGPNDPPPERHSESFDRSPKVHRLAVTVVFFLIGAGSGTWAARVPAIKERLHLSAGVLGLTLLGLPVGAVAAMSVVGAVLVKVKPRRVVGVMFVPFGLALCALSLVDSPWQLFVALFVWGASTGSIDVAMNIEAAALQDFIGRRIMSRFHASYSIGGLTGAGAGAWPLRSESVTTSTSLSSVSSSWLRAWARARCFRRHPCHRAPVRLHRWWRRCVPRGVRHSRGHWSACRPSPLDVFSPKEP